MECSRLSSPLAKSHFHERKQVEQDYQWREKQPGILCAFLFFPRTLPKPLGSRPEFPRMLPKQLGSLPEFPRTLLFFPCMLPKEQ